MGNPTTMPLYIAIYESPSGRLRLDTYELSASSKRLIKTASEGARHMSGRTQEAQRRFATIKEARKWATGLARYYAKVEG